MDVSQISSSITLQSIVTAVTASIGLLLLVIYANQLFSAKTAALEQCVGLITELQPKEGMQNANSSGIDKLLV
jgi:hypothetical protein